MARQRRRRRGRGRRDLRRNEVKKEIPPTTPESDPQEEPASEPSVEDPRLRILRVALNLFTEKGYFNTSIAEIREAADVSTGTIYHHFKTKEAIAAALFETILESLSESFAEIWNQSEATFDRLRKVVELFFALGEEAPQVMRFLLLLRHREFIQNAPSLLETPPFQELHRIIAEGIERGEIRRMDSRVALSCFCGVVFQVMRLRLEGLTDRPLDWCLLDAWTSIRKALISSRQLTGGPLTSISETTLP